MRVSKEVEIKDILSFSGLEEDVKSIDVPPGRYDYVKVFIDYTVVDDGIAPDEDFSGICKYMELGEGDNKVFEVHTDEIFHLISMQEESTRARFYDWPPTSGQSQHAYYVIEGPFNLTGMSVPQFTMAINAPTDEFDGATSFTAKVRLVLLRSDRQDASGVVYHRVARGADTIHHLPLGPGSVTELLVLCDNVTELTLPSSDGVGGKDPTDFDINTRYPVQYVDNYNIFRNASTPGTRRTGRYLIQDIFTEDYAGRALVVECDVASPVTMFAKNLVVYA